MRMYGGFGSGRRCALCDAPIHEHQFEYELDFPGPDRERLPQWTMQLHLPCYHAWNIERGAKSDERIGERRVQVA